MWVLFSVCAKGICGLWISYYVSFYVHEYTYNATLPGLVLVVPFEFEFSSISLAAVVMKILSSALGS